ncbi:MAG: serine/threonine-protein kinase, partial [Planctomycetota bacterium]
MGSEERVAAILAAWTAQQQEGDYRDPEDVIREHPALAEELRAGFAALEYVDLAVGREPAAEPVPERIGSREILEVLGVGGMGTVYLAEEALPDDLSRRSSVGAKADASGQRRRVGLKVIHPHLIHSPGYLKRFRREAEIGRRVRHPNVVQTYGVDVVQQDRRHFHCLVMEYVQGQTLRELAEEFEQVPEQLCRHIGLEVAKGLVAIHAAGAIHRDLKPENVLLTDDEMVKVMDLGVAHVSGDEALRLSRTGAFVGSLLYAAPEQFGGGPADGRCDLYALGLTLYELAGGKHPFLADDVRAVLRLQERGRVRRVSELNPQ